jgi:hypothetical protein
VEERIDAGYLLGYALAVAGGRAFVLNLQGSRELSMKSYDAKDHGASDQIAGQAKRPWVTPSLEIIALQSAEGGTHPAHSDGAGGHFNRPRS